MPMFDLLVTKGKVVIPKQGTIEADVAVKDGKVAAILARDSRVDAGKVIDATGLHVLPGAIDPHVHWGYTATFEEQCEGDSRAGAIGGVTTGHIMAVVNPSNWAQYVKAGNSLSMMDYFFGPIVLNAEDVKLMDQAITEWGVPCFKFLMGYKSRTGAASIQGTVNDLTDGIMYDAFVKLASYRKRGYPTLAVVHAENSEITAHFVGKTQGEGKNNLRAWHEASPGMAEAENILRAGYFAELAGCPLYIVHLGAKESVEAVRRARRTHPEVYGETCPQYLAKTCDDPLQNLCKISPPIRTAEDQAAVWEALRDGTFESVGTDNSSTLVAGKKGTIWDAVRGFPGTGTLLPILLSEGVNKGRITLERAVEVVSYNPARIFGLYPRKGTIQVGSDADFAIVNMNQEKAVTRQLLQHYGDFNIYEGMRLKGWPVYTVLRGTIVQQDGKILAAKGTGKNLEVSKWAKVPAGIR
ncbi:MAG: amidohydrolase family protein [Chloroflexi bacterium]|nr:amidohydrolase family protein [Chloroflexota bacterium]